MMNISIKITKQWTENNDDRNMTMFLVSGPGFDGYVAVYGKDHTINDIKVDESCWLHLRYSHGHQFSFMYHEKVKIVNAVHLTGDDGFGPEHELWLTKDAFEQSHITFHFNEGKKQEWGHVFVHEQDRPKRSFGNRVVARGVA